MNFKNPNARKITFASLLAVGAVVTVLSVSALARDPRGLPPPPFPLRIDAFTEFLDLSADQADKLKTVIKDARAKRIELREKYLDMLSAKRAEMDALMHDTRAAAEKILTEEQRTKLKEEFDRRDDRREERRARRAWRDEVRGDRRGDCNGSCNKWDDDDDDSDDGYGPRGGRSCGPFGRGGCR